jgi:hypothetical protein
MIQAAKIIGIGLATIGLIGAGVGIAFALRCIVISSICNVDLLLKFSMCLCLDCCFIIKIWYQNKHKDSIVAKRAKGKHIKKIQL